MKTILYMDITTNGMIGKTDGNSDFTSEADLQSFLKVCRGAGTIISGRKTYEVLYPDYMPLESGTHYVLTSNKNLKSDNATVKFTDLSPTDLINKLKLNGVNEVVIIGGQNTVTQFMEQNLIDEICLDIEPIIYGQGMSIFNADFETKLELLEVNKLSSQTVQLHYKVVKS